MKRKLIVSIFCLIISAYLVFAVAPQARTFYSQNGNSKLNGQPVPVGTVITAYDPQGILCGQFTTTTVGQFSFDCVGDDTETTETDEGGSPGDIIDFYMNGNLAAVVGGSAEWQSGYGEVDIEATSPECNDTDGDGYGVCPECGTEIGCTYDGDDCDDSDSNVYPGANELCNNIDDDCDTQTDEDFTGLGDACTVGIGECEDSGNMVCNIEGTGTECDATPGTPSAEVCDGLDNDCDDAIDNGGNTLCDNGLFCDGQETCGGLAGCQAGTPPDCADEVDCTDDSCNEETDSCNHIPNWIHCDDGIGCTGDSCHITLGCSNTPQDLACDDQNECTDNICDPQNDCQYPNKGAGTECGLARDCPDDTCAGNNNYYAYQYPVDGHDTCDGQGTCVEYDCSLEETPYCTDNDPGDGVNNLQCGAPCDQESDCICPADECIDSDGDGNEDDYADYPQYGSCLNDCSCDTGASQGEACAATITIDDGENCGTCNGPEDCDDGEWCNGEETCVSGFCQAGTPRVVDDGVSCTDDSCDEANDIVVNTPNDANCDDGAWCNGAETCDADNDCQPGAAQVVDDGVSCTDDSCDEANDVVVHTQNNANCDDGAWCNGDETCDSTNDCQAGVPPVVDDGVACTDDSCDEVNDQIVNTPNDVNCDDGTYCNGQETCHQTNGCQEGTQIDCTNNNIAEISTCTNNPDNNQYTWDYAAAFTSTCDEENDICTTGSRTFTHQCRDDDASDGVNGIICGAECDQDDDCNCPADECIDADQDGNLDDYADYPADGECLDDCTCDIGTSSGDACQVTITYDDGENCGTCNGPEDCDDGEWCNGEETCVSGFCQAGTPRVVDDGVSCTDDSCDETNDQIVNTPNDDNCPDREAIGTCDNNPDNNPFTWDAAPKVEGVCDPVNDCQLVDYVFDPVDCTLSQANCQAECDEDNDCACPGDHCIDSDGDGNEDDYADYPEDGNCLADCSCDIATGQGQACEPAVTLDDPGCKEVRKIPIEKGISMFSLPLIPDTPKSFNDLQNGCVFTPEYQNNGIAYYNPRAGAYVFIDGNTILHPGQGYFTTQENDCELIIQGTEFTIDKVGYLGTNNVYTGWNMFGATSEDIANINTVKGTCNFAASTSLYGFDPINYRYFGTWGMDSGKGYFAKVTGDCNLG